MAATENKNKIMHAQFKVGDTAIFASDGMSQGTAKFDGFSLTIAADAVEDAVHAARRAATRTGRDIEEWRETAAYRIKKAPFLALAIAAGAGLLVGAVCGRWGRCASQQKG